MVTLQQSEEPSKEPGFYTTNRVWISYDTVRTALGLDLYPMTLVGDDIELVIEAVNQGIDAHLEACFCPELGDSYQLSHRTARSYSLGKALICKVSAKSLPVLLRRLVEIGESATEENAEPADRALRLVDAILTSLDIDTGD